MRGFIEIANKQGLSAQLLPFGATLARLIFADRNGKAVDVVLGFDDVEGYLNDNASLGKTVGRVANRIRNAHLSFDEKNYELERNNGEHFLHGGSNGIGNREWEVVRHSPQSVSFCIHTDQSIDGLPGDAKIDVTYTVNDRNQLIVEHHATCDQPGILAITNHAYWNLDGDPTIANHILEVDASEYVVVDESACPTGGILSVTDTLLDFRSPKKLNTGKTNIEIDHDLVLTPDSILPSPHLRLTSPKSGIELSITTSYPTIHLYSSMHLNCSGRFEEHYGSNKGLAIEPQFHSSAPTFDHFPDISLRPGQVYSKEIVYTLTNIE